jgi:hypothetical protein
LERIEAQFLSQLALVSFFFWAKSKALILGHNFINKTQKKKEKKRKRKRKKNVSNAEIEALGLGASVGKSGRASTEPRTALLPIASKP